MNILLITNIPFPKVSQLIKEKPTPSGIGYKYISCFIRTKQH